MMSPSNFLKIDGLMPEDVARSSEKIMAFGDGVRGHKDGEEEVTCFVSSVRKADLSVSHVGKERIGQWIKIVRNNGMNISGCSFADADFDSVQTHGANISAHGKSRALEPDESPAYLGEMFTAIAEQAGCQNLFGVARRFGLYFSRPTDCPGTSVSPHLSLPKNSLQRGNWEELVGELRDGVVTHICAVLNGFDVDIRPEDWKIENRKQ